MPTPEMSVLMPVYNAERWLAEAVESVLAQTLTDFELIAIDDGSIDGSAAILAGFAARDSRVRVVRQPVNAGLTNALIAGYSRARGDLIARMDADDVCHRDRFRAQRDFLAGSPRHVLVGSLLVCIDECGRPTRSPPLPCAAGAIDAWHMSGRGDAVAHPAVVFRRGAYEAAGGYRPEFEPAEDFDLWLRMGEVGEVAVLPERLLSYRVHALSVSRRRAAAQDRAHWRGLAAAVRRRRHPLDLVPFADLTPSEQLNWIDVALDVGDTRRAWAWAWRRVRQSPSRAAVKQLGKAACGRWLTTALPLYDRLRGRPPGRRSALDHAESPAGGGV